MTILGSILAGHVALAGSLAHAEDLLLGNFAIGSDATDLNGFRLSEPQDGDGGWALGARLTDEIGGNSGRAIVDLGRSDSGMRFSLGVQMDWEDTATFGPVDRNQPFSFGSEQSSQAIPYVGFGYVGRISDRFEITLDAGASYLGSDENGSFDTSISEDRSGSVFGWSPTVTISGRVRF
ncbi:MAG: hypothetical protein AAGF58_03865 [Pseudomonadota bacterium]